MVGGWDLPSFLEVTIFCRKPWGSWIDHGFLICQCMSWSFYLLALVQELGRRFPWTVRDTPAPPDFPPPGGTDQEAPEDPVACTGKCIVCRSACTRLQPGHKHCKCRAHLHWALMEISDEEEQLESHAASQTVDLDDTSVGSSSSVSRRVFDAWHSLEPANTFSLPWETGFWKGFFDNSPALENTII